MGYARVTINQTWFSQVCQNVLHFDYGGASAYDPAAINSAIGTYWIPAIRGMQLATVNYFKVQVRDMSVAGGLTTDYAYNVNGGSGSAVEGWGPLCYLWSFRTAAGGHSGLGRCYFTGCYPGNVVTGRFSSASMDQQNTIAALITTRFLGSSPTSGIHLAICPRTTFPDGKLVTSLIVRQVPGVQRRRNIGVGI